MAQLTLWRLERKKYADTAFSGEGARLYGNRFNSKGTRVIYTAESLPLALLETLVGLTSYKQLYQYVFFQADVSTEHVEELGENLPTGWDTHPPRSVSKDIGDAWVSSGRSLVLRVPSVIVPYSYNYLMNPEHPAFDEVEIHDPESLPVDERLVH